MALRPENRGNAQQENGLTEGQELEQTSPPKTAFSALSTNIRKLFRGDQNSTPPKTSSESELSKLADRERLLPPSRKELTVPRSFGAVTTHVVRVAPGPGAPIRYFTNLSVDISDSNFPDFDLRGSGDRFGLRGKKPERITITADQPEAVMARLADSGLLSISKGSKLIASAGKVEKGKDQRRLEVTVIDNGERPEALIPRFDRFCSACERLLAQ